MQRGSAWLALLLLGAACTSEGEQAEQQEPGRSLPAPPLPSATDIDSACAAATSDAIRAMEASGAIVEPTYHAFVSRDPICRWELPAGQFASCRFEQAEIHIVLPSEAQIADERKRLRDRDWKPMTARLVYAGSHWRAQGGCRSASSQIKPPVQ